MVLSRSLYRKYRNNELPTDEETQFVKKALQTTLRKSEILQGEVQHLQLRLNGLIREKGELSMFLAGHRGLFSPLQRLVPEVLQEIFYHCLPTAHNALMSNKVPPLVLSRVCRQWREIVLCTPKLWSSIHIIARPTISINHYLDVARREAITAWLSRSGVLPLSISMSGSPRSQEFSWASTAMLTEPCLDLILPFASRWKNVYFNLPGINWPDLLTELHGSQFPVLESLHINGKWASKEGNVDLALEACTLDSIVTAPSLQVISLPTYCPRMLQLPIPWSRITGVDLGVRPLPPGDICNVLTLCGSNLEMCSISIERPRYSREADAVRVIEAFNTTLAKLLSLKIIVETDWDEGVCALLGQMNTPTLRHLTFKWNGIDGWGRTMLMHIKLSMALCLFLRRLISPLEELDLVLTPFFTVWARDILSLVPSLKRLSLKGYGTLDHGVLYTSPILPSRTSMDEILGWLIPNFQDSGLVISNDGDDLSTVADSTPQHCFCSQLEVLHYGITAGFSSWRLLDLLHSRTIDHGKHKVVHLRRFSASLDLPKKTGVPVGLGPEEYVEFRDKVGWLERETGILVDVQFDLEEEKKLNEEHSTLTGPSLAYQGLILEPPDGQWVDFGF